MKVNFLEANNGDCILVSYEYDGYKKNIMIDSGVSKTYEYKIGRLKKEGSLKKVILDLQEKDQNIDLLIITHVDDDHIGGTQEVQAKWERTSIRNWSEIYPQLCIFFSEIMEKYTK